MLDYFEDEAKLGGTFEGLIDTGAVAVIGHSYGGHTALSAAGARLHSEALKTSCSRSQKTADSISFLCEALVLHLRDMAGLAGLDQVMWPSWRDDRVDAVVSMAGDAVMFGEPGLQQLTVPVMALGGTPR